MIFELGFERGEGLNPRRKLSTYASCFNNGGNINSFVLTIRRKTDNSSMLVSTGQLEKNVILNWCPVLQIIFVNAWKN